MEMTHNPFVIVLVTILVNQVAVFATTIYLHRTLTHRAIKLHTAVAFLMHLVLTVFTGISPREWVAVHRKHHQFSDEEGDPHSPVLHGVWDVFFKNVLYYRRTAADSVVVAKYAKNYKGTVLDKVPGQKFGVLLGWLLFLLAFGWLWGTVAFVTHAVVYIHLNAAINSFCHMVGYHNFNNQATNIRWLAWFTGGEAYHNNHHEAPTAADFAMRPREHDPAWVFIELLEIFGLAEVKEYVRV